MTQDRQTILGCAAELRSRAKRPKRVGHRALLVLVFVVAAPAQAQEISEFEAWEFTAAGLSGASWLTLQLLDEPPPAEPTWTSGMLFDDLVRAELRGETDDVRQDAASASDLTMITSVVWPLAVDGLLTPLIQGEPTLALGLTTLNLQAFAFNGLVTTLVKRTSHRERPAHNLCRRATQAQNCDAAPERHTSFFSGHTSVAFTGAGLMCNHHVTNELWGVPAADVTACVAGLLLATSTGVLRVVADRHYTTDVVAGAAVGLVFGWLLPALVHPPRRSELDGWAGEGAGGGRLAFQPELSLEQIGVGVSGSF